MEEGMNPQTVDNSTADVSASAQPADSITSVMDAMGSNTEPEAAPATGEKAEGNKEESQTAENPGWMAQLRGEHKDNVDFMKQLSKFKTLDDLAKSYSELEKKLGTSVSIPGENSSAEEIKAFYQKLGVPEDASGYDLPQDGQAYKDIAFNNNLTVAQAKNVFSSIAEIGKQALAQNAENLKAIGAQTQKELESEWGKDYQTNLELVKRGISDYGGSELSAKLKASGLIYDKQIVKMFAALGKMNSEATVSTKGTAGGDGYVASKDGGTFNYDMSFINR